MMRFLVCLSILCASACGDSAMSIAPGLYHLPDRVDAVSLEIQPEGTFRWRVSGCDYFGGDEGLWRPSEEGILLLPLSGEATFLWNVGSATLDVDRLDVSPDAIDEALLVTGFGESAAEPQRWIGGGLCTICGQSSDPTMLQLGPTGFELCDNPFPN